MSTPANQVGERKSWRARLVDLPRLPKRLLLIINDFGLLALALWLAFCFRLNHFYLPPNARFAALLALAPLIGLVTFHFSGLYRLVTRFISPQGSVRIFAAVGFSVLFWSLAVLMSGMPGVPRSVIVMYGVLGAGLVWASRQLVGWILKGAPYARPASFEDGHRQAVVIYGAGAPGVQLVDELRRSGSYLPVGFVDDDRSLWGQVVAGLKVYRPNKLPRIIERDDARLVLLAMPAAQRKERRAVIKRLEQYPVEVKTLPVLADIASGRVSVSDLRPVEAEDLLGRDPVPPDPALLARSIRGKNVLVTGCGGSIGSELSRQILRQSPRRLVLLDLSEAALYPIEIELSELLQRLVAGGAIPAGSVTELASVLGSVQDAILVRDVLQKHEIETIYHAAAYKHVPIIEQNPVAGLRNNTFGTLVLADAARVQAVERMVLVSTDKAVRPTNIMGASKRLAELILQAHAAEGQCQTVFTMVRFGNVLDSSGSVVRRFRQQIESGGPVTVTHPDMVRYFMSIPEAAELVLQAGAMARGGEVFVLDMGEPVKIDDLARSMVRLMGREVQDAENPDGEIAIAYTGLRPGEKLYEELLIGKNTSGTDHPRIMRNDEPRRTMAELDRALDALRAAMAADEIEAIQAVLLQTVDGYRPEGLPQDEADPAPTAPLPRTLH